jgi:hypothetical protein
MTCASLGLFLFVCARLPYLRYAADLSNLHAQERIKHAQALGLLWRASLFGSVVFGFGSLFVLGWRRWVRDAGKRWSFRLRSYDLGCNVRALRLLVSKTFASHALGLLPINAHVGSDALN